jgi:hypothetical protein
MTTAEEQEHLTANERCIVISCVEKEEEGDYYRATKTTTAAVM